LTDAAVRQWPTPVAANDDNKTPEAHLAMKARMGGGRKEITSLNVKDHKDGANPSSNVPTNSLLGRQAPRTFVCGKPSSTAGRKLNPRFVEWLMGWPLGWTDCGSVVTVSSLNRLRTRS
jgi:hypothetical protein